MPLSPGTRLGHYDVTALLGEGGMGQVWQATDTQLNREVALKILPEAFAADPDRLARFTREAQILASLNHPNIAAIYGIEEAEGTRALVLELVEGPTLADRISKGPIPLDEALPIAKQIAEALEAAHEAGVIHRDLKPANIKVREDGTVKVLDFGLAKALDPNPEGDPSQSPTLTAGATQMGVIMGTAAYMSPEQARGKTVDKRTDIWAFGCVLFEMLTGRRAFQGEDVSLTLASVMKSDVNVRTLSDEVPPAIRTVLWRCLEKDPKERLRDIGDVRLAMHGAFESQPRGSETRAAKNATFGRWIVAPTVIGIGASILMFFVGRNAAAPPEPATVIRAVIPTADPAPIARSPFLDLAVSPDGSWVVYRDNYVGGEGRLNVRRLDDLSSQPLGGVAGVVNPFVSPDGRSVGFVESGMRTLMRVPVQGGTPATIAEAPAPTRGAYWAADDVVVFGSAAGMFRVAATGGEPEPLTTLEGEGFHAWPFVQLDGNGILFVKLLPGERTGGSSHECMHGSGQWQVRHAVIEVADVIRCCPEAIGCMNDELGFVVQAFNGTVVDGHAEVVEDVLLVAAQHPGEVSQRWQA